MRWLLALIGIVVILYSFTKVSALEGFEDSPATADISVYRRMFIDAGCKRRLEEGHVWWWRKQPNMDIVKNDMNAYAELTSTCRGNDWQHEFCNPGKCRCGWAQ